MLMSSGTVATAIDSLDSHDERFQRVRRAMQRRPVEPVPAANQHGHSASEDHSEANVEGHVDATEPLRTAALRAAFATLDSIILPRFVEEAPICHEERASLPQGSILERSSNGIGGSGFGGVHPSRAGLEIDAVAPTHVAAPSTTGRFDCQGQVAPEVPIIRQRRVVDVVGGQWSL